MYSQASKSIDGFSSRIPFLGKKLPPTPPNQRQEGAMKALWIVTLLGVINYIDQSVPSAVKILFQKDLNLTDAQTSYPTASMVSCHKCIWCLFNVML